MAIKRVFAGGDLHSGQRAGLTPLKWQGDTTHDKWAKLRGELWGSFTNKVDTLKAEKPFDIAIWNGDLIDGRGERSGGTELITTSQLKQCEIAVDVIKYVGAKKNVIIRGTPYHTGVDDDFENIIGDKVDAVKVGDQEWIDVNGVIFDAKHKVGGSTIPHGKAGPISKERLWNLIHNDFEGSQPKADVILRSHVHWYHHVEDVNWHGFVLPALQGLGTKYGSRQCSGLVHFGFMWFDIKDKETWEESPCYHKWILKGSTQKKEALIL